MNRILVERSVRKSIVDSFMKMVVSRYLLKKSKDLIDKRGFPIAVFGNDWIGLNVFLDGVYEDALIEDFFSIVSKTRLKSSEMSVVDIGANIGNHSLQFSKKFKTIHAFEPNPRTFEILKSNTSRVGNIFCHNMGLGREKAVLELRESWGNMGGSSAKMGVVANSTVDIEITKLDLMSDFLGKVDAIKIDVEGMELDVLMGASDLLAKYHPVICLEQHESEFVDECNETPSLDFLRSFGYRLFSSQAPRPVPYLIRRLNNIYELIFGEVEKRVIVEYEKIPRNNYAMIFAIHPEHF